MGDSWEAESLPIRWLRIMAGGVVTSKPGRPSGDSSIEGKEDHLIHDISVRTALGDELQILDAPANRRPELMRVDNAAERLPFALPSRCLRQEIVILGEHHSLQHLRSIQEFGVGELAGMILLCREHVDLTKPQAVRNGPWNVVIHV
jgi:hypothetical protein